MLNLNGDPTLGPVGVSVSGVLIAAEMCFIMKYFLCLWAVQRGGAALRVMRTDKERRRADG